MDQIPAFEMPALVNTAARTSAVLAFVVWYKTWHDGNSPTYDEMELALKIPKSVVAYHLERLKQAGTISWTYGKHGIEVIGGCWIPPEELQPPSVYDRKEQAECLPLSPF